MRGCMDKQRGIFSSNYMSLQLQLRTLLQDCGGEGAACLLDSLCCLTPSEQALALKLFSGVIDRILAGEIRLKTAADCTMKEIEENLYSDLVRSIESPAPGKLEVIRGGKYPSRKESAGVIELHKIRNLRKSQTKLHSR